ncbi:hypothetical protein KAR91_58065 [Candidatus Pacearchaeota archaeon]|nr:hypothetical protein [Candidatus Pacearchaeota archaeon]
MIDKKLKSAILNPKKKLPMKNLEAYYTNSPMEEDFEKLCDPRLSFDVDREEVNELILNLVIKYTAEYLSVKGDSIQVIRRKIAYLVNLGNAIKLEKAKSELGDDNFSMNCLSDIRQTSAVFKEIAFSDRFKAREGFIGLDIGCGTGILMPAMAIAAKRKGIGDVFCTGIERVERAVAQSRNPLTRLLGDENYAVIQGDALGDSLFKMLFEARRPDFWVSETIGRNTPPIDLSRSDFGLDPNEIMARYKYERNGDPFVEVLGKSMNEIDDFPEGVIRGRMGMFPDIFNGFYQPNRENSFLFLETGVDSQNPLRLEEVGIEFEEYEDFGISQKRWEGEGEYPQLSLQFLN